MTQVWMLRNSDTDIQLFNRQDHILPSLRITFSACQNVNIIRSHATANELIYIVEAILDGKDIHERFEFQRLPVWTEPCHL